MSGVSGRRAQSLGTNLCGVLQRHRSHNPLLRRKFMKDPRGAASRLSEFRIASVVDYLKAIRSHSSLRRRAIALTILILMSSMNVYSQQKNSADTTASVQSFLGRWEIPGITGGALDSHEALPGPIYLQGAGIGRSSCRE